MFLPKIQFFRQSFFKLGFGKCNILIDPFIRGHANLQKDKALIPCPCVEKDLKNISLILITHEHTDHFDKKAIECIAKRDNAVVVGHESTLKQLDLPRGLLRAVRVGEKISTRGVDIEVTVAHHPRSFCPNGFLLKSNGDSVYHSGDTELLDELSHIKAQIALLPIGGTFTMDLTDAVKTTKMLKPKYVIPMHYNTFESIKADANEFKNKIEKSVLSTKPIIMKPGQTISI